MGTGIEYRTFCQEDTEQVVHLWNSEMPKIGYKEFLNGLDFKAQVLENSSFLNEGCILAWEEDGKLAGIVNAVCKKDFLAGETRENTPGYLNILLVGQAYRGRGIGSSLLALAENYLHKVCKKKEIMWSCKCPINFSWYVNSKRQEHNKAPGIKKDSYGYEFLSKRGYKTEREEVSYYLDLTEFFIPEEVRRQILQLEKQGVIITDFDELKHHDYDDMFSRLHDESFRKKFYEGILRKQRILIAADGHGGVCGTAGTIFRESNGRGFFSALAVDPICGGRHIGNVLFFSLCLELKRMGAEYMTIFVTSTNFARKIYEKAGFSVVQEWAVMKKGEGEE